MKRNEKKQKSDSCGRGRKKRTVRIISDLILLVLIVVFLYSGYRFFSEYSEYKRGEEVYGEVNEAVVIPQNAQTRLQDIAAADDPETQAEEAYEPISVPDLDIDYDALAAQNPDFIGVLYIPALDLYYPVTHSHDNSEYLNTLFTGESSVYGCIFLEKDASADFSDYNSFIYGHNMKNGTMFGSLKRFERQEGLCDSDPYMYIYTKSRVYKYHIFSYFQCAKDDPLYNNVRDDGGYDQYVTTCQTRSEYTPGGDYTDDFSGRPPLITLSTCVGVGETSHFLVVGAMVQPSVKGK
ncbi:MAG: class B sortase [Lachnospira sp.]|nr:class B sortase [Lachnospira sp.]